MGFVECSMTRDCFATPRARRCTTWQRVHAPAFARRVSARAGCRLPSRVPSSSHHACIGGGRPRSARGTLACVCPCGPWAPPTSHACACSIHPPILPCTHALRSYSPGRMHCGTWRPHVLGGVDGAWNAPHDDGSSQVGLQVVDAVAAPRHGRLAAVPVLLRLPKGAAARLRRRLYRAALLLMRLVCAACVHRVDPSRASHVRAGLWALVGDPGIVATAVT